MTDKEMIIGKVIHIQQYGNEKSCKLTDGVNEYYCIVIDPIFLEKDDTIAFYINEIKIGTSKLNKGKNIYVIPKDLLIVMNDTDDSILTCFQQVNYKWGKEAFNELLLLSANDNLSLSEYMYKNCSNSYKNDKYYPYFNWWVRHRGYRRLWNLGLKNKYIDEYSNALQCNIVNLYNKLTENPGALRLSCVPLELAIDISKKFKLKYNKNDLYLARISRFIYNYSYKYYHTCINKAIVKQEFSDIDKHENILINNYNIKILDDDYYIDYNYNVIDFLTSKFKEMLNKNTNIEVKNFYESTDKIDDIQRLAVDGALNTRLFGIFGGGGSGKTTCIRYIVRNLIQRKIRFMVCGPTGCSVVRIRDKLLGIGHDSLIKNHTMTLHMLLTIPIGIIEHLIIDEISMVSHSLLYEILLAYPGIRYITVAGDDKQLQPIKWGNIMFQILKSKIFPYIKLKKNYRTTNTIFKFDNNNKLISTEHCILQNGKINDVITLYNSLLEENIKPRDIIIITPTNNLVNELNSKIQDLLYKKKDVTDQILDKNGRRFILGDKVILLQNNYEIDQMNGDIGIIISIDGKKLLVEFNNKSEIFTVSNKNYSKDYSFREDNLLSSDMLALAHTITIHKSQGSEWSYVIIYVPPGEMDINFFNFYMIYTAISRTMEKCYIIGDLDNLHSYINKKPEDRYDKFANLLIKKINNS